MAIDIDDIDRILGALETVEVAPNRTSGADFDRIRKFRVKWNPEQLFKIEWWQNISYLHIGQAIVPFDDIQVNGFWPNKYKTNLMFRFKGNHSAIVPIEHYSAVEGGTKVAKTSRLPKQERSNHAPHARWV